MVDASFVQTDFRGGEWSAAAQGRMDDKDYRRGLNVCFNAIPTEAGSWTRRPGTRWMAQTAGGAYAWLLPFHFSNSAPYIMELTNGAIRFYSGPQLVLTADTQPVATVSTANPAVVTLKSAATWVTGDLAQFLLPPDAVDNTGASAIAGRQFALTRTNSTTFSLADPVTGVGLDGSTFTVPTGTAMGRVLVLSTSPYTDLQIANVHPVQCELLSNNTLQGNVVLLHNAVAPQVVANSTPQNTSAFAQFTLSAATFTDGPYFDPVAGSVSANALGGTITLSAAPANTFASTDVGRSVRLFSEPANWAVGTAYATGNTVKYTDGNYYTALAASTGKAPNVNPTLWAIDPTAAIWTWGTIATYISATSVTLTLKGPNLLFTGTIPTWRLGVFSATTGYPTCGLFYEGRLWLAGAQGNRFDASNSNDIFNFAPTATDGTVGDSNAISYVFNSDDVNMIQWMTPSHSGIIAGSLGGEWLISASQLSDPLTPTSIQAHRASKYKCSSVPAVAAGFSTLFVQAQGRRLMEYTADAYSGKFLGRNMSEKNLPLSAPGIAQIAYQQDLQPIVWTLMTDGTLAGLLYKRESSFTSEPPTFAAWHRHALGSGCLVESIAVGPSENGVTDTLYLSVVDPVTNMRHVEMMADVFLENNTGDQAWHLDGGMAPTGVFEDTTNNTVKMTGFYPYIGKTVTVFIAGIDLGDVVVAADGSITVSLGTLLTDAVLTAYTTKNTTPHDTVLARKATVVSPGGGQTLQSFVNTSIVTGSEDNTDIAYDPAHDRIVICSLGSGATNGLMVYKASTGAFLGGITAPTLFATGKTVRNYDPSANVVQGPFVIDKYGYLIFPSGTGNQVPLVRVNIADPTNIFIQDCFGLRGNGFTSSATKIPAVYTFAAVNAGDQSYIVCGGLTANTGVEVIQTNSRMKGAFPGLIINCNPNGAFIPAENGVSVCAGAQISNGKASSATAYIMGFNQNVASTANINLYSMTLAMQNTAGALPLPVFATIGAGISPANIDATWSHISNVYGPIFDKTDGHVMIWVQTNDAVANQNYVIKLSTATGAILWATAVQGLPSNRSALSFSNIQFGTLQWQEFTRVHSINTSNGALTNTTLVGTQQSGAQFSDDVTGAVFAYGSYVSGGGAPTALNATVNGTFWYRLQGVVAAQAAAVGLYNMPRIPAAVGFTYTSQGQLLRPVGQEQTGARNGPGFAKTRRVQKVGLQVVKTQSLSIGTAFDNTHLAPVEFKPDSVNAIAANVLFTGIVRPEVSCDYDFDGMIAWQTTRPYPVIVTAVGGFLSTQDI